MEQENKISTDLVQKNIDPISYFEKDKGFVLVYKKTEKLASAVYMVTSLFSESEPMKWTLRKEVSSLMSFMITYKDITSGGYSDFLYNSKSKVLEIVSLLEISSRGGLVSAMNFSILKQEFWNLINAINTSENINTDSREVLTKGFFEIHMPGSDYSTSPREIESPKPYVTEVQNTIQRIPSDYEVKDKNIPTDKDNLKKSNRQTIILGLFKKKKELTIKDVAQVVKDCSEKTIQRELNSFIYAGVLKRSGVRRWSKYSLNS